MASARERIWDIARSFQPSRVLLTAVELGVFGALGDEPRTSEVVAMKLKTDPRATDRLMNALVALGLLGKDGGMFRNTGDTLEALVPGRPGYVGGGLMHIAGLWKSWSTLTDAVRAGTSVYERDERNTEAHAEAFMAAMHSIASSQAQEIISHIDLSVVRRVLDVGGGSGAYSIGMCRAKPDLECVVFDQPPIVPITRAYVEQAGMSSRISTVVGDFNRNDLPVGFDLVFASHILHSNSPTQNAELMKKFYRALNPGGQVVVQEFVVDEDRTSPTPHALFSLNMLVGTEAGDTYTQREITAWLTDAGFADVQRIDPPTGTNLIIGWKKKNPQP